MAESEQNVRQDDDVEMVGLSGSSVTCDTADSQAPVETPPQPPANNNRRQTRTRLHDVLNETWGLGADAFLYLDDAFLYLDEYADSDSAKKTKTGFEIKLRNGGKVMWNPPDRDHPEMISAPAKSFNQDSAEAIVALARLHGWKTLNLHGNQEQKEMLWLAVQRQNLQDQQAYERNPRRDKDGKKIEYVPLTVSNFAPLGDSKILQQWLEEKARHDALRTPEVEKGTEPPPVAPPVPVTSSRYMAPLR